LIEELHDQYICIAPTYRGGRLYGTGDILLVPHGEVDKSKNFEPLKATGQPEKLEPGDLKVKHNKKEASEEEA
jgi:hypothetical protein